MVGDRASVVEGVQSREMVLALSPGCLMVTMVARVQLRGSWASMGEVSEGCPRGGAGDFEWAQPLGMGPQSSPVSWHWGFLFVVNGV